MRSAIVAVTCTVVALSVVIALAVKGGPSCEDVRFDPAGWDRLGRDEYAACVVEVQPFQGLDDEALVRRLGPPDERRRRGLTWWIGRDDLFGMEIEMLVIPLDDRGRARRARILSS